MNFKKSLKGKIIIAFSIVMIMIIVQGLTSTFLVWRIGKENEKLIESQNMAQETQSILTSHNQWLAGFLMFLYTGEEFTGSLDYQTCSLGKWLNSDYVKNSNDPELKSLISKVNEPHRLLHQNAAQLVENYKSGSVNDDQLKSSFIKDIKPNSTQAIDYLKQIVDHQNNLSINSKKQVQNLQNIAYIIDFTLFISIIIFTLLAQFALIKSIIPHIKKITSATEALAKGDTSVDLDIKSQDEIGVLSAAYKEMIDSLIEQEKAISSVANGDLTVKITPRSEKDNISISLNVMISKLNDMFTNMKSMANQVRSASEQLSSGATSLAQASTEQASIVENINITVSDVSEQANINSETAIKASELGIQMQTLAEQGSVQMKELDNAVHEINDASTAIGQVIKLIDDIAFQTNILALNAAVEAARAGSHGKGFAVVADEVSNLASKSAEAAKNVTELINETNLKAEKGYKISEDTIQSIDKIVEDIKETGEIINQINSASKNQSDSLLRVNQGISQVVDVVNLNSATSEQSAAAAQELSAQANNLESLISNFKINE